MTTAAVTIVVSQVITPEGDIYFSAFNAATGEKVAPWADADTPEEVMEALLARAQATDEDEVNEPELDLPAEIERREARRMAWWRTMRAYVPLGDLMGQ